MSEVASEFQESGREELIRDFALALGLESFNLSAWLLIWFSDIEVLRDLVARASLNQADRCPRLHHYFRPESTMLDTVITTWRACRNDSSISKPAKARSPSAEYDSDPEEEAEQTEMSVDMLCQQRDHERCVITKAGDVLKATHLAPSLDNTNESFWEHLALFWSPEKVEAWRTAAEEHNKSPQGYITLASGVERFWELALFALKPISRTENSFTTHFFWMHPEEVKNGTSISVLAKPSLLEHADSSPRGSALFRCDTEGMICSGHGITLQTEDSHTHPLPSWDLMQMQWMFQRISALRGPLGGRDEDIS